MAAFKQLRDVCNNFDAELRRVSTELFSAKIEEPFEDGISKKMQDLSIFTSKLRLLKAKPLAASPQIVEQEKTHDTTIKSYEEAATTRVMEQQLVKFLTQSHAVRELITTQDSSLHPEMVARKEKIKQAMMDYKHKEVHLRHLDALLKEKQTELASVRQQWDDELWTMREMRDRGGDEDIEEPGPIDRKLRTIVDKMEIMRWLLGKLVTDRSGGYDWLSDPHRRLNALKLARHVNTVATFTEE